MRLTVASILFVSIATGCSCGGGGAGITIHVTFGPGSVSRCVIAGVQVEGTATPFKSGSAVSRGAKNSLVFGVARTDMIKGKVTPFARGYDAADCSKVDFARFDESAVSAASLDLGGSGVQSVTLELDRATNPDGGNDGGSDGGNDGGSDAGLDAGVDAGCVSVAENCLDGIDNDCDSLIDCADDSCDGKACVGGGICQPGDAGVRTCVQAVETLCDDGLDNDNDTLIDCADPSCVARRCNDNNACTTTDFCSELPDGGGFCDAGTGRVMCSPTAPSCRMTPGACDPSTGSCSYPPTDAGSACDDGNACSHSDRCNGAGACLGTTYTCASSTCVTNGQCRGDGGCTYSFAPSTTACDDLALCTYDDRCTDGGICTGTGYSCTQPPPCFSGTACLGDGGCGWSVSGVGSSCPGAGTCASDGGCLPAFGYQPANFDPSLLSPDGSVVIDCNAVFNSGGTPNWMTPCAGPRPVLSLVTMDGGAQAVVMAMNSFVVTDAGSLTLYGARPVILAVFGDATVSGSIVANSRLLKQGPGADRASCGTQNGENGTDPGMGGGGAGGAGNRTAGANGQVSGSQANSGGDGGSIGSGLSVPLLGGCHGGNGGGGTAFGGRGGGAVQLSVAKALTIGGLITVSAAGGTGGIGQAQSKSGGGGGGSAGTLILEADSLTLTSSCILTANGGAGGGGCNNMTAGVGEDGAIDSAVPANGGALEGGAGAGGDGAAGGVGPKASATAPMAKGGGGGGGAAGWIFLLHHATSPAMCSRAATVVSPASNGLNCP